MDKTMKKTVMETSCMEDTAKIAYEMAQSAEPGQVYALIGDLGVGKTVFTKGFAEGLGIEEPVSSPTFTILQIYEEGRLPLYHWLLPGPRRSSGCCICRRNPLCVQTCRFLFRGR